MDRRTVTVLIHYICTGLIEFVRKEGQVSFTMKFASNIMLMY